MGTIGEGRIEKATPSTYLSEGLDIGEGTGTPIDFSYKPPFQLIAAGDARARIQLSGSSPF
jgi:hypothetical protein